MPHSLKVSPILTMETSRSVEGSSTGLVFAMYNIGSVAAVFFTGPTNDYFGRRWGMFVGALIVIIGTWKSVV